MKAAHIKAGKKLSDGLLKSIVITEVLQKYNEYGIFNVPTQSIYIDNIGDIKILKVTSIGEAQDFPKSICDIRRNE